MPSLEGKVALVTGSTSGIGRGIAEHFAALGARVVVHGRSEARAREVADRLARAGHDAAFVVGDLAQVDACRRIVRFTVERFGGVDVLVNNAASTARGYVEDAPVELWDAMMAINLRAPFRLMRAAAPHLAARKGSIVNVSSVNGLRSFAGVLAYHVSKAGVDQLTRCAALELAPLGVRVNAVNPGVTVTNLHRRSGMGEQQYAAFLERSKTTHPLGRPGNPGEIASMILYLASDQAGWMTGETIPIDGGRHLTCAR